MDRSRDSTVKLGSIFPMALALAMLAACSDDPAGGSPTGGSGASGATSGAGANGSGAGSTGEGGSGGFVNPTGESITLTLEPFEVPAGTERQVCKVVNLPVDVPFDVVRLHSTMEGTSHHFNVYKALTNPTAPASQSEGAVHDCSPASGQLGGDEAYLFGSATPERTMATPAGVAFHLEPGQRIILEQHVINPGGTPIQGGATLELSAAAPELTIEHHADIIWFANWGIYIPPNDEVSSTSHCTVPYDVEVFGLMSHTHKLGSHFSIEKWTSSGSEHLYDSTDWAHPPYQEFDPTLSLAVGEGLEWTCTWTNTTSSTVGPGKNSTDEMCIAFAAAYPKVGLSGQPIMCNN
jgi:hypothetical protein